MQEVHNSVSRQIKRYTKDGKAIVMNPVFEVEHISFNAKFKAGANKILINGTVDGKKAKFNFNIGSKSIDDAFETILLDKELLDDEAEDRLVKILEMADSITDDTPIADKDAIGIAQAKKLTDFINSFNLDSIEVYVNEFESPDDNMIHKFLSLTKYDG